ncbi:LppA family lipoprotein [Phycicoccus jejuensis]
MGGHRGGRGAWRRGATVLAAVALAATAGCSSTTSTGGSMDPREQLAQRPTFEEAEKGYLALLVELRDTIDAQAPGLEWQADAPSQRSRSVCSAPFDSVEGAENANYSIGRGAKGVVPDERWQATVDAMLVPLREQGFSEVTVLQDEPGAHQVSAGDPATGARVEFGTKAGTVLTLYGACFLPAQGS